MRPGIAKFTPSLFIALLACAHALGQESRRYPASTLVTRASEHDANGKLVAVRFSTSYLSASGDWRSAGGSGNDEYAAIYRRDEGVYQSRSLSKASSNTPLSCRKKISNARLHQRNSQS